MIINILLFSLSFGRNCPDGVYQGSSCNTYFKCVDNRQGAEIVCPSGYLFNSATGGCDQPHKVACPKEDYEGILRPVSITEDYHSQCCEKSGYGYAKFGESRIWIRKRKWLAQFSINSLVNKKLAYPDVYGYAEIGIRIRDMATP